MFSLLLLLFWVVVVFLVVVLGGVVVSSPLRLGKQKGSKVVMSRTVLL